MENMNDKNKNDGEKAMGVDEIEVMLRKFGDEQSSLFDKFERLSFEVHLNQAILGRSLSDHHNLSRIYAPVLPRQPMMEEQPEEEKEEEVEQPRKRRFGFHKAVKKFLSPIGKKLYGARKQNSDGPKDLGSWKTFSKSFRF